MKNFNYYLESYEKIQEFYNDLCEDLDIQSHPKKGILFKIAWKWGNRGGLESVYEIAKELATLIK